MDQHGIHLMPPWTFLVGATTGGITALIGWITPEVTAQWIGVVVNASIGVIWLYGYWLRTCTASQRQDTAANRKSDADDDEISDLKRLLSEYDKALEQAKKK